MDEARLKEIYAGIGWLRMNPLPGYEEWSDQVALVLAGLVATAPAETPPSSVPFGDGSLITASRTKGVPLAAASVPPTPPSETDVTTPTIPPSRPLPGALMVVCTHVGLCSECVAQADASGLRWWTPAQAVGGTSWEEAAPSTSPKRAQPLSAGRPEAGLAGLSFSESSDWASGQPPEYYADSNYAGRLLDHANRLKADLVREREAHETTRLSEQLYQESLAKAQEEMRLWRQQAEEANVALRAERVLREAAERADKPRLWPAS